MTTQQAREIGKHLGELIDVGQLTKAYDILAPNLTNRTPFTKLGKIGECLGNRNMEMVIAFLDLIAEKKTEGGWVIIGEALHQYLHSDSEYIFSRCRDYIITADVWYATDILGERVPGPALVDNFQNSLNLLSPWREDKNRWVRRTVGVAVHFWAKRSKGSPELRSKANSLLSFLQPMFSEWEMDAVKGIGWGLKTLGRYYPDLVEEWLSHQIKRKHRRLMLRKALTYLPANHVTDPGRIGVS